MGFLYRWWSKLFLPQSRMHDRRPDDVAFPQYFAIRLEPRFVLSGSPIVTLDQAGNVAIGGGDSADDGLPDSFAITSETRNENETIVVALNGEEVFSRERQSIKQLTIQGSSDADTFSVQAGVFSEAAFRFEGSNGPESDRLIVEATPGELVDSVVHHLGNDGPDTIEIIRSVGDAGRIEFTGIEQVVDRVSAVQREIDLASGDYRLDGTSEDGGIRLQSTNHAKVLEVEASSELTVMAGQLTVGGRVVAGADVTILADHVDVASSGSLTSNETIRIQAAEITHEGSIVASEIRLEADSTLTVDGTIDASHPMPGGRGGTIHLLGDDVVLLGGTFVDASGDAGGGEVLVGGDYSGSNIHVRNATTTFVHEHAVLRADALSNGDGGKVIVWADESAVVAGSGNIRARGGAHSGDGGFVETSGKRFLRIGDAPDASAPIGNGGTWLIDPINVLIANGELFDVGGIAGNPINVSDQPSINWLTVETALTTGISVSITTADNGGATDEGNIVLGNFGNVNMNGNTATLELIANNNITVMRNIAVTNGTLNIRLTADSDSDGSGSVVFQRAIDGVAQLDASGVSISVANDITTADVSGNGVSLNGNVALSDDVTISVDHATNDGNVTVTGTIDGAQTLAINAGGGDVNLQGNVGSTTPLASLTVNGGQIDLSSVSTTGGQTFTGSNIDLNGSNYESDDGPISFTGSVDLISDAAIDSDADDDNDDGNVSFSSTIDGGAGLSIDADTGTVGIAEAVGGTTKLTTFAVSAASQIDVNNVASSGGQEFTGSAINLNGTAYNADNGLIQFSGPVELKAAAATAIDSDADGNGSGGGVTFSSTVAGSQALTIDGGVSGPVTLSGALNLSGAALNVTDGGTQSYDAITAGSVVISDATTSITFDGKLTVGGSVDVNSAGTILLNKALETANSGTVQLDSTGKLTIGADGDINSQGSVSLNKSNSAGSITTAGNITTANADVTFGQAVTLTGGILADTSTGGGDIEFSSTIRGTNSGQESITLASGGGGLRLLGDIGLLSSGRGVLTGEVSLSGNSLRIDGDILTDNAKVDINVSGQVDASNNDNSIFAIETVDAGDSNSADIRVAASSINASGMRLQLLANGTSTQGNITLPDVTSASTIINGAVINGGTIVATSTSGVDVDGTTIAVGAVTSNGKIDLDSTAATGDAITLSGNLDASGGAGAIDLVTGGGRILLTGGSAIEFSSDGTSDRAIDIDAPVDAANGEALTLVTGTANIDLDGPVGENGRLGLLTFQTTGDITYTAAKAMKVSGLQAGTDASPARSFRTTSLSGQINSLGAIAIITNGSEANTDFDGIALAGGADSHGNSITLEAADDIDLDGTVQSSGATTGDILSIRGATSGVAMTLGGDSHVPGVFLENSSVSNIGGTFDEIRIGETGHVGTITFTGNNQSYNGKLNVTGAGTIDVATNLASTGGAASGITFNAAPTTTVLLNAQSSTLTLTTEGGDFTVTDGRVELRSANSDRRTFTINTAAAGVASGGKIDLSAVEIVDNSSSFDDILLLANGSTTGGAVLLGEITNSLSGINGLTVKGDTVDGPASGPIFAAEIDLEAQNGIGQTNPVNLSAVSPASIKANTLSGDIVIQNSSATSATATSLTTGSGSVTFDQSGGGTLTVQTVTANDDVTIRNTGGSTVVDGKVTILNDGDASTVEVLTFETAGDLTFTGTADVRALADDARVVGKVQGTADANAGSRIQVGTGVNATTLGILRPDVTITAGLVDSEGNVTLTLTVPSDPGRIASANLPVFVDWSDGPGFERVGDIGSGDTIGFDHQYILNPGDDPGASIPYSLNVGIGTTGQISILHNGATEDATVFTATGQFDVAVGGIQSSVVDTSSAIVLVEFVFAEAADVEITEVKVTREVVQIQNTGSTATDVGTGGTRHYVLRIVILLDEDKLGESEDVELDDNVLANLAGLFEKLPDDRYRIYLITEDGSEQLITDVNVREKKAVELESAEDDQNTGEAIEEAGGAEQPDAETASETGKAAERSRDEPLLIGKTIIRPEWEKPAVGAVVLAAGQIGRDHGDGRSLGRVSQLLSRIRGK